MIVHHKLSWLLFAHQFFFVLQYATAYLQMRFHEECPLYSGWRMLAAASCMFAAACMSLTLELRELNKHERLRLEQAERVLLGCPCGDDRTHQHMPYPD